MTKIMGVKLTHDAAIAGIDDGKLVFCVELEKINNNPRYTKMPSDTDIEHICKVFKFWPDLVVVDGWKHGHAASPYDELDVASYHEFDGASRHLMDYINFDDINFRYRSYTHIAGHIVGTYVTSPFAKNRECAYSSTWDGGQNPRVHYFDPGLKEIKFVGSLFELYGIIYGIMGYYYGPYKKPEVWGQVITADKKLFGGYDVPGKLMSYIALGTPNTELLDNMMGIYYRVSNADYANRDPLGYNQDGIMEHEFMRGVMQAANRIGNLSDADVLNTVHTWLQTMLVENACHLIPKGANLMFTGGSALNIKWNSALRSSGHFSKVYVPPFPNDSGSALGAAACAMLDEDGIVDLDWSVYCGMPLPVHQPEVEIHGTPGWHFMDCNIKQLAAWIAQYPDQPVVFLNGRAEVGPRALGNRSILCAATEPGNKKLLNNIKRREEFRPVAPICMEEHAPQFFDPGTPDPYMLFDHKVRTPADFLVPAILHTDGTARLQTVNKQQNPEVYALLSHYFDLTGIPCLCNTSANLNGSGFFPDIQSAMHWGGAKFIWSNNTLYWRE